MLTKVISTVMSIFNYLSDFLDLGYIEFAVITAKTTTSKVCYADTSSCLTVTFVNLFPSCNVFPLKSLEEIKLNFATMHFGIHT